MTQLNALLARKGVNGLGVLQALDMEEAWSPDSPNTARGQAVLPGKDGPVTVTVYVKDGEPDA